MIDRFPDFWCIKDFDSKLNESITQHILGLTQDEWREHSKVGFEIEWYAFVRFSLNKVDVIQKKYKYEFMVSIKDVAIYEPQYEGISQYIAEELRVIVPLYLDSNEFTSPS